MDVDLLERELVALSEALTEPAPRECLWHYLDRMLDAHGCAGHRFTRRWARSRPRASEDGLVRWASARGGCCCDCEVVVNALDRPVARSTRAGATCGAVGAWLRSDDGSTDDGPAPCTGA